VNIIDFWRRWHITLSRFLRDYLYIPLGGNRRGPIRRHANLLATMLLGGLWHGAGWTFVIWGGLHGLYLVVNHAWRALRERLGLTRGSWLGHSAARALTFVAVVVAWVFFRAQSFSAARTMLSAMFLGNGLTLPASLAGRVAASPLAALVQFKPGSLFPNELVDGRIALRWIAMVGLVAWFAPNTQELLARYRPALGFSPRRAGGSRTRWLEWRPSYAWSVAVALIAAVAIMNLWIGDNAEFIYFQF
jgi:alginate O-acetyltransferase complex protein AlgI